MAKSASNQLRVTVRTETGRRVPAGPARGQDTCCQAATGAEPQHLELPDTTMRPYVLFRQRAGPDIAGKEQRWH